ncbi:MAG TPA: glycosyl hydrolase [Bacteroidia bacterium]|nr:glycosyl hydrolase [Bacteroidia bacterium]
MKKSILFLLLIIFIRSSASFAQSGSSKVTGTNVDTSLYNGLHWRNIGPWRGGRSLAVTGVANHLNVYYFGAVGGGVWKSDDFGKSWNCISDSAFRSSSVGSIAVAPSDPNILYVGMGEPEMRGNISFGDGIYKSTDAGRSWKHTGLPNSYAIASILIHPQNPDIVYAACMGRVFGRNAERGVYRTKDGGKSWEKILYKNDSTGCVSIAADASNPNTLYASLWQACRNPWSLSSGGAGSGIYKSDDGGDTWKDISRSPGLPVGVLGKISLCTTPANPDRIYASIENENGGIFRSNDKGIHWQRTTDDRNLRKRPWYFSTLTADPKNADVVWCMNVELWRSTDGGMKFNRMPGMHGDFHDAWINPSDPNYMIIADDGGACVSTDGGRNYTELDFPTAQFYHVTLDNDFPYNVYGAQQDNSSVRIASATDGFSIDAGDWYPVAGGEAGYIVPDPSNSEITYGGEYDGYFSTYNKKNNQYRFISVWPEQNPGHGSADRKYRFNWTYPICFSPHDNKTIYVTSQYVHRTHDGGNNWETISPDLTRHKQETLNASGGPITKDNTGAEAYANIFAFAESPLKRGIFWTGSDDGLIHLSKDDGKTWKDVTPKLLGDYALISIIEPSGFDESVCYVAANKYKLDDTKPYLLKTTDFGNTWSLITTGIPASDYCRVIREDPNKKEILYAGTERGVYISFNGGSEWQSLKLNLPVTPVHDIRIQKREKDLVIATHGRAFWILDDITPLYQMADAQKKSAFLFTPRHAYRKQGGSYFSPSMQTGENAPNGLLLRYYFKQKPDSEIVIRFFDAKGDTIIIYSSVKDKKGDPLKIQKEFYQDSLVKRPGLLPANRGMNTFVWDLRYPDAKTIETGNNALISGSLTGPVAVPGNYTARLYLRDSLLASAPFTILKDPRITTTDGDFQSQFDLLKKISGKQTELNSAINTIRNITKEINETSGSVKDTAVAGKLKLLAQPLLDSLKKIEEELTQPKAVTNYDLFNFPNKLNDKLAGLHDVVGAADAAPTSSCFAVYNELSEKIDSWLKVLDKVVSSQLPVLNTFIEQEKIYKIKAGQK